MLQSPVLPSASTQDRFKILIIASLRYPIAEPFAGGLEAHTWALAQGLRKRGHSVLVAGADGSDPAVVGYEFDLRNCEDCDVFKSKRHRDTETQS